MGRTLGCGDAGYVVKLGAMSEPLKRMKAPLLPLHHTRSHANVMSRPRFSLQARNELCAQCNAPKACPPKSGTVNHTAKAQLSISQDTAHVSAHRSPRLDSMATDTAGGRGAHLIAIVWRGEDGYAVPIVLHLVPLLLHLRAPARALHSSAQTTHQCRTLLHVITPQTCKRLAERASPATD